MQYFRQSVQPFRWHLASLLAVIVLCGCATGPYYGLSSSEWNALSPEEQAQYEADYLELQRLRAERAAGEDVDGMLNRSLRKGTGVAPWDRDRYSY